MKTFKTPEGEAGFSVVKEARGFKGSDENRSFSQVISLPKDEAMTLIETLMDEAKALQETEFQKARAAGKPLRPSPIDIPYKDFGSHVTLSFRRKEIDGAPKVVDHNNQPYTGLIRREHRIVVAFGLKSYAFQGKIGFTLVLLGVKVMKTVEPSAEDLFGGETVVSSKKSTEALPDKDLF